MFPGEPTGGEHCDRLTVQASIHCCAFNIDGLCAECQIFCVCVAEYEDASLSSWVNKERFQGYLQIDGFTLYELGETGAVCSSLPLI